MNSEVLIVPWNMEEFKWSDIKLMNIIYQFHVVGITDEEFWSVKLPKQFWILILYPIILFVAFCHLLCIVLDR
jgi:hypothetical protein